MKKQIFFLLFIQTITYIYPTHRFLKLRNLLSSKRRLCNLTKTLGHRFKKYNPNIQFVQDCRKDIVHRKPTLFLHGFRSTSEQVKPFIKTGSISGNVITLNLPGTTEQGSADFTRTSFGQENDVIAGIFALKMAKTYGLIQDAVDIYGYSRGAGTAGNIVHTLAKPSKRQAQKLQTMNIDERERKTLLHIIQRGSITLDRPLVNMRACLQALISYNVNSKIKKPLTNFEATLLEKIWDSMPDTGTLKTISKGTLFSLALSVDLLLALVTYFNYSPLGLNLWDSSNTIRSLGIPFFLHTQKNDTVVSNVYDTNLYAKLAKQNPANTYLMTGDNGGHQCDAYDMVPYVQLFRKKYGSSYNPDLISNQKKLQDCQPHIKGLEDMLKHIRE